MNSKSVKMGLAAAVFGCFGTAACLVAAKPKSPPRHAGVAPAALLRIAFVLLQNGDAAGARQVYVYLAFNGNADGARGVGEITIRLCCRRYPMPTRLETKTRRVFGTPELSRWRSRAAQLWPRANPLGGLTPADVPLIEAEILSRQPGPPHPTASRRCDKLRHACRPNSSPASRCFSKSSRQVISISRTISGVA